MMNKSDVVVLGAGASGLVCAHAAAAGGLRVLLIEHADKPGRKIAVSGGGKCNFTNRSVSPADYASENLDFCRSALAGFTTRHSVEMMEEAGIPYEEREEGQLFCTRPAGEFVRFLVKRCEAIGCGIRLGEKVKAVEVAEPGHAPARFIVRTTKGEYFTRNVVVALGGPAWPQVGATGSAYELARKFGHRIVQIRPALVGLTMPERWVLAGLQGISLPVSVTVIPAESGMASRETNRNADAKKLADSGRALKPLSLLFTHRGISGPAALQASLYWRKGMHLSVDFLPTVSFSDLLKTPNTGKLLCKSLLKKHLPDRVTTILCPQEMADIKCASLSKQMRRQLCDTVHSFQLQPAGTEGFAKAEVTAGGIGTEDISSRTMESRRMPGLYFCGEALDVTGRLGGYNLHWAFASGTAAGRALAKGA